LQFTDQDWATCLDILQFLAEHPEHPRSDRLNGLIAKIYREGKRYDRREAKRQQLEADRTLRATTAMVQIQRDAITQENVALPPASTTKRRLNTPDTCYICKQTFVDVHFFYHLLCPTCATFNYQMRDLHCDLTGRTALVTGGRVKIGHQMVLRLLRDGARVLVVTRFPHAAALRLDAEPDAAQWRDRLHIYGLDLRNIPAVEQFAAHLNQTEKALDIVIHNAAQTIRRPPGFYAELVAQERELAARLPAGIKRLIASEVDGNYLNDLADGRPALPGVQGVMPVVKDVLPADRLLDHEERADSRDVNSWLLRLDDVSAPEMLEVQLVNAIAPFVLNARLKPLLMRATAERRFIVNVSAMEGQFSRHKTIFHPHTNMAKAALNMMTRTSAEDYANDGIYMTSVDTGWVTDENPAPKRERGQQERAFFPPLDIADGMARIYHPIAYGISHPDTPHFGVFLKDYAPCPW